MPTPTPRTNKPWAAHEDRLLRQLYPDLLNRTIAAELGRSTNSIKGRANVLGLRKSAAFIAQHSKAFKPGHAPWNKGSKGTTGMHPNSRRTQFKKGRPPQTASNYRPIGSHRIAKREGILERKVTDDHPVPARRWQAVHRLVWEAAHGPIPKGHVIAFKPGQKTTVLQDITIDRLECISRAENLRRNGHGKNSLEMMRLYQLKGAIARQINRIQREHQQRQERQPRPTPSTQTPPAKDKP